MTSFIEKRSLCSQRVDVVHTSLVNMSSYVNIALEIFRQVRPEQKQRELQIAVQESMERGLSLSARFLAELLNSVDRKIGSGVTFMEGKTNIGSGGELSLYLYGKSLFDCREYLRAASVLQPCAGALCRFLRWYALFLHGEKRKEEELVEAGSGNFGGERGPRNMQAATILQEIEDALTNEPKLLEDAYICWIRGIAFKACGAEKEAMKAFTRALERKRYLWAAWTEIHELGEDFGTVVSALRSVLELGDAWMFAFFLTMQAGTFMGNSLLLNVLQELSGEFADSVTLMQQTAQAYFSAHDFEQAADCCKSVRELDPYCLDGVDLFSNVLFVQEDRVELSSLAQNCVQIDKYRAETCCVLGNYFALRQNHEKAVQYFRRALVLNRSYVAAWTLMGHEFLEMRNTSAAVEAYRRAIDLDPRDFRPFYGLGQTYELLHMPHYALYYFEKAASLRPSDDRMWVAVSQALQDIGRTEDSIRCLQKALSCNPENWNCAKRAGDLLWQLGRLDSAARFYEAYLNIRKGFRPPFVGLDSEETDVVIRMATYHVKRGEYQVANEYANMQSDVENAEKREMLRQIKAEISKSAV
jgi:anaphase-promoting complex subunit 8